MKQQILDAIVASGENGVTAKELKEQFGEEGLWSIIGELKKDGKVFARKVGSCQRYISTEYQTENDKEISMGKADFGSELQGALLETIAKFSAGKVAEEVMPLVRELCIKEFGMTPVVHEFKVTGQPPVSLKAELPPCFNSIFAYSVKRKPVLMTGPAGTGKGYLARQIAKAHDAEFYEVNAVKNEYGLTGFVDANSRFVRTPFYDACKAVADGKKAVFLFDEMDCSDPEVLKIFNEALSSKEFTFPNDEHLDFKNLIILSACNTFGTGSDEMYCGQQLDASTLDRFAMVRVDYNRKVEMAIARGDEELVDFIDAFRRQTEKNGLQFVASYRSIDRIVDMRDLLPPKQVMRECFIKSMADDDLRCILDNMSESFASNTYYRACKGENVKYPELQTQPELELTA